MNANRILLCLPFLFLGCISPQSFNTFKPRAYANVKTWDVDFMFVNAPLVTETKKHDSSGKDVTVTSRNYQPNWALSIREDIYYSMLGKGVFKMVTKGAKADATVMLSFDSSFQGGGIGVINLTVVDRDGEPLSRLKYENTFPDTSLESRKYMIEQVVALLVEEVSANR